MNRSSLCLSLCVSLRCPVSVWRARHSPPLLSIALGNRALKQRSAASPPTWQSWATLKRSSFPNDQGVAKKAQMEPQVCEEKDQRALQVLIFLNDLLVPECFWQKTFIDDILCCFTNLLHWTPLYFIPNNRIAMKENSLKQHVLIKLQKF